MRFIIISTFLYFLCFTSSKVAAQINLFPAHFEQLILAKQALNPASPNINQAHNLSVSNKFYTGAFSKINNFYFIGNFNLSPKDSAKFISSAGIKLINEKEGDFINRSKYYASYAIRTRIHRNYWLGLGVNLGRAGYVFKGTDVSTSGSSSNWDGDMGLVFHNQSFCVATSINQMFNSLIRPKNLAFRWARFYTIYTEKKLNIGLSELCFYAQNQFIPQKEDILDIGANLTVLNQIFIGTNVWVKRNVSFILGLKNFAIDEHQFSIYASYNTPISTQNSTKIHSYEMSVYYQFR